ncbi:ATP-dependent DNA helicase [Synechocystis salina]|uniref:ATP-dependent DNA helicase n=1 Tax=Synechocystis salina LEGE 00031 TaxID=1828736 RepID=A0ABR9VTF9_9SYNC|nr:ATP-dependent DNA helicase [Synechocystis salina]MBE9242063.1 ATP-dependent DNA helicase [Synechocystis salina LEGE 00041]MBE9254645.1 ATP-dependent DNA helicase [Synechocystis salina LEGE 00031]
MTLISLTSHHGIDPGSGRKNTPMGLLETQVHHLLKAQQRQQTIPPWPHSLTMGRLVSRALRLRRSALIQTGCLPPTYGPSYLLPCLLSDQPVRLVTTPKRQQDLETVILPTLQTALQSNDPDLVITWPEILTPDQWLQENLASLPNNVPALTAIEQVEHLEDWTRDFLSHHLDWNTLQPLFAQTPQSQDQVLTHWSRLSQSLFARPINPHGFYPLDGEELQDLNQAVMEQLANRQFKNGAKQQKTDKIQQFWQFWQEQTDNHLLWAEVDRQQGKISLHVSPVNVQPWLQPIWQSSDQGQGDSLDGGPESNQAAFVLIGSFLDAEKTAPTYCKTLGLGNLLCLKFSPHRLQDALTIYLPDRLPLPNTPAFQTTLLTEIERILTEIIAVQPDSFVVILLDDLPLKAQLGSQLAAKLGSGVKVEPTPSFAPGILVAGWQYWCAQREQFPPPALLILGTLPIPSLENPLVAKRVQHHKRHHQDWFRDYLLPVALKDLQQAVLPLRESGGWLAILDDRVNSRSYGREVLKALAPYGKRNYFDPQDLPQITPAQKRD